MTTAEAQRVHGIFASLSDAEFAVLLGIYRGWTNRRIAYDRYSADMTIKNTATRLYQKLEDAGVIPERRGHNERRTMAAIWLYRIARHAGVQL